MSVIIGSARIDENGNAKGGKAGNQNGREISTQNWYLHKKGWRVFRALNSACAEKIAIDMRMACANPYIGYDQSQRNTLYNAAKLVDFDCSRVKTYCETDCSALVRVCCAYAGIMLPNFTTGTESEVLLDSGAFREMSDKSYTNSSKYLHKGDILVTKTRGHTVVVLSNGSGVIDTTQSVLVTSKSVWIRKNPDKFALAVGVGYMGETYPYMGEENDWYIIKYGNDNCYVTKKYTELV